jgi:hypothetical protein
MLCLGFTNSPKGNQVGHILISLSVLLFSSFIFSSEKKEQANFTYPNGANYKGELKDGIPNGQVTSTFRDGGKYVGEYKHRLLNGLGTFTWSNGNKYVGEFKDGLLNGRGTSTFK